MSGIDFDALGIVEDTSPSPPPATTGALAAPGGFSGTRSTAGAGEGAGAGATGVEGGTAGEDTAADDFDADRLEQALGWGLTKEAAMIVARAAKHAMYMEIDLAATVIPAPEVPFLHEVWTWEGDVTILPRKWSAVIESSFEYAHCSGDWFTKRYASQPQFDPRGVFFITSRSDVCGTCFAWRDREDSSLGQLNWLAVNPKHRRQGIGRALVRLVLKHMKDVWGLKRAFLSTEDYREAAIKLYESEGFVKVDSRPEE